MLALIYAYLCVPRGLKFIVRWLAMLFVIAVFGLVCLLFYRILITMPDHPDGFFHRDSHSPMSPDSIRYHPHHVVTLRRVRED